MDTTTAAAKARVTITTIRTWCRLGAIAAVKVAGRWVIEAASLAYRIGLTARPATYSVDTMTAIGGNRWSKAGKDRVYLNNWTRFVGLEADQYNTGNISSATLNGEDISNGEARRILGAVDKVYFDTADNKVHILWGDSSPRTMDRQDMAAAIFGGIRTAIAAL